MPQVRERASGRVLDVYPEMVDRLVASGDYEPVDDGPVNVRIPGTDVAGSLPRSETVNPLTAPPVETSKERTDREFDDYLERRYGSGLGNRAAAFGEGLASSLTLGLADPLLDSEGSRARERFLPGTRLAGEGLGVAASLLVPGAGEENLARVGLGSAEGLGALAEGAKATEGAGALTRGLEASGRALSYTPLGLATRAERAVSSLGEGAGLLGRTAARAAGGAAEGAIWSGGRYASDVLTGDQDLGAEQFLAEVGTGALLGGAVGGAGELVGAAARRGADALEGSRGLTARASELAQAADRPEVAADIERAVTSDVRELDRAGVEASRALDAQAQKLERQMSESVLPSGHIDAAENALKQLRSSQERVDRAVGALRRVGNASTDASGVGVYGRPQYEDIVSSLAEGKGGFVRRAGDVRSALREADATVENLFAEGPKAEFRQSMGRFSINFSDGTRELLTRIAPRKAADVANGAGLSLVDIASLAGAVGLVPDDLKDNPLVTALSLAGIGRLGMRKLASSAGEKFFADRLLGQGMRRKMLEAVGASQNRLVRRAADLVGGSVRKVAGAAVRTTAAGLRGAEAAVPALVPLASQARSSRSLLSVVGRDGRPSQKKFEELRRDVSAASGDPAGLRLRVGRSMAGSDLTAPGLAGRVADLVAAKLAYVSSVMPRDPRDPSPVAPGWSPSARELRDLQVRLDALDDPTSVLRAALDGTLRPAAVEAVRAVYPATYREIRAQVLDRVAERGGRVPYAARVRLSILLDQPLDPTMSDGYRQAMAESAARRTGGQQGQPPAPSGMGARKMTVSDSYLTGPERVSSK